MAKRRCVGNPLNGEFSLCGDAFDIAEDLEGEEDYEIAGPGQSITCPRCVLAIREIKAIRNPLRPRSELNDD